MLAALGGLLWWRQRSELSVVGELPSNLRLVTEQMVKGGGLIDLGIPFVGQVTYPEPQPGVPGMNPKTIAGVLRTVDQLSPTMDASLHRGSATEWTLDGKEWIPGGSNPYAIALCPKVFGQEVRTLTLRSSKLENPLPIRLPATGLEEPKISPIEVQTGPLTVRLVPKPWISPAFPLRFDIQIEGSKAPACFVQFQVAGVHPWSGPTLVFVSAQEPGELQVHNWTGITELEVLVREVTAKEASLLVTRTAIPSTTPTPGHAAESFSFKEEGDKVLAGASSIFTRGIPHTSPLRSESPIALRVGDRWIGSGVASYSDLFNTGGRTPMGELPPEIRDGQRVTATVYTMAKPVSGKAKVTFPDAEHFRGPGPVVVRP